jgi:hypothetical protein
VGGLHAGDARRGDFAAAAGAESETERVGVGAVFLPRTCPRRGNKNVYCIKKIHIS